MALMVCKLQVNVIGQSTDHDGVKTGEQIGLSAVYNNGDPANASWSKWTPFAEFRLNVTNPQCFDQLKVGDYVYVTLDKVEDARGQDQETEPAGRDAT